MTEFDLQENLNFNTSSQLNLVMSAVSLQVGLAGEST